MFDTRFASDSSPGLSQLSSVAALLLHLIIVVVTIELTQSPKQPRTVGPRAWVPPAPVIAPQFPELPYMPTVDAARLMRYPLHAAALAGWIPRLRRQGITGEVKLEYVIDHTGRADSGSVRVIASTDAAFAVSCIEAVLGAGFKPARRSGRPVASLVSQTIRFQNR